MDWTTVMDRIIAIRDEITVRLEDESADRQITAERAEQALTDLIIDLLANN